MDKKKDGAKWKKTLRLFLTFMKIGLFTFGGGYAMIPLIERETVERKQWITGDEILEIVAIAESTPGPIAINAATFVGWRTAGAAGAAAATAGVVLPSFLIITAVSFLLARFRSNRAVSYAFAGIRAGVLALIVKALWSMFKKCPKGLFCYLIMAFAFAAAAFLPVNVIWIILLCAAFGVARALFLKRRDGRDPS